MYIQVLLIISILILHTSLDKAIGQVWVSSDDNLKVITNPLSSSLSLMSGNSYSGDSTLMNTKYFEQQDERQSHRTGANLKKQTSTNKNKTSNRNNLIRKPTVKRIVHPSLHAVWDEYNHLCLLAKFQATFTIKYETSSGTAQLIDKMPANARSKGRCDQFDDEPILDVMWKDSQLTGARRPNSTGGFTFRVIFQKFTDEERWGVQQMQLLYNTGHPVFHGSINPKKFIVRSNKDDYRLQFHTSYANSMLCPSPPPIQLYDSDGTLRVIARLSNMQLQAFEFSDPREGTNFDSFMRCEQVSFGSGVAHPLTTMRNDSLTFAIGVMTVCIASLTVVGYALYRSYVLKSDKYKNII